jgi:hypothetical protein
MSYDEHCSVIPVSWSSCSRTDFINQYNAHKNRWCMAAKTSNFCGKSKKLFSPVFELKSAMLLSLYQTYLKFHQLSKFSILNFFRLSFLILKNTPNDVNPGK